jgi:hypothetical protein
MDKTRHNEPETSSSAAISDPSLISPFGYYPQNPQNNLSVFVESVGIDSSMQVGSSVYPSGIQQLG